MFNNYFWYGFLTSTCALCLFGMVWAAYNFLVYRRFRYLAILIFLFSLYAFLIKIYPWLELFP